MCTSYKIGREIDLSGVFDVEPPMGDWREEVYKDYSAPIVLQEQNGTRVAKLATFGLIPRKRIAEGVKPYDTMNCRSETVAIKRSFSGPWRAGQLCLIPCTAFYEPCYETGKHVRWEIGMVDKEPFAIAGLWRAWSDEDGLALSFSMLMINADDHPLMRRFHKPGDEKRSVVIVPRAQYQDWLSCRDPEVARTFLSLYPAELMAAQASPLPPRQSKSKSNVA